jgi:DNA polymerase-3 subunit beta
LTEANGSVTLKFGSEEMELFTQSTAVGEGRDKLLLPYQGEPFQVVFNLSYLLAPFKYFHGEALTMEINDPTSPVMLTNGDFLYIVMPIRAK